MCLVNTVNIFLVVERVLPIKGTDDAEREGSACVPGEKPGLFWPAVVPTFLLGVRGDTGLWKDSCFCLVRGYDVPLATHGGWGMGLEPQRPECVFWPLPVPQFLQQCLPYG